MKILLVIMVSAFMIAACNLKEGAKETGDALNDGFDNVVEGVKETPKAIGDAGNNAAGSGEDTSKE